MRGDLEKILLDTEDKRYNMSGGEVHSPAMEKARCLYTIGDENV
jgi:hypothetical protein